jgi:hypothetical protein
MEAGAIYGMEGSPEKVTDLNENDTLSDADSDFDRHSMLGE